VNRCGCKILVGMKYYMEKNLDTWGEETEILRWKDEKKRQEDRKLLEYIDRNRIEYSG